MSTPTTSLGPVAAAGGGGDGGDGGCVGDDGGDDLGELVPMLRLYYAVDESVRDRQTDGYSTDNTGINHAVGGLSCLSTLVTQRERERERENFIRNCTAGIPEGL